MRRLLFLTIPACVFTGWSAVRTVRDTGSRVASDVVATFVVDSLNVIELPRPGTYRAIGLGSRQAIQSANGWEVSVRHRESGTTGIVQRANAPRARDRENQPGLDMLFAFRVATSGRHDVVVAGLDRRAGPVTLRISQMNTATAGAAMKAFGLATLFSVLLLASAALWFRR